MRRALRAVRRRYNWPRLTPPLLMYSVFQDDIARPQSFLEAIVRHSGASGMGSEACTGNGVSLSLSLSLSRPSFPFSKSSCTMSSIIQSLDLESAREMLSCLPWRSRVFEEKEEEEAMPRSWRSSYFRRCRFALASVPGARFCGLGEAWKG